MRLLCGFLLAVIVLSTAQGQRSSTMKSGKSLLPELTRINDDVIASEMKRQRIERGSRYEGALLDQDSVVSPIQTAQFVQTSICGYVTKESKYYQSKELLSRMTLAAKALVNLQHEDGTIDLVTTNFHSTPDLGFTVLPS